MPRGRQKSASVPAAWNSDRAGMKELFRHHHVVLFEDRTVLHHELHVSQRVNFGERITCDGDQVGEEARLDGAAFLDDVSGFWTLPESRATASSPSHRSGSNNC